jgi:protein ImuB
MFAALHIPDFPVVAAMRACPTMRDFPCAILETKAAQAVQEKLPLLSINSAARTAGISAGWPLNRALVRCPDLRVLARDLTAEAALRDELIFLGDSLTPDVEITAADTVLLDLSSRTTPDFSTTFEVEIWQARALTPDLAHLAARHQAACGKTISPGDLAPLPLAILASLAQKSGSLALLDLWGLKTLGDFMKLPRQALIERLGPEVGRWHDLLHGKTCRLLRLHRPPESFGQTFDFDDGVISLDPMIFALKRLLHTLAGRLASRHLAASRLDFRLMLESGGEMARRVRLPEPQTAVEGMLAPLQTLLESLRLESPVVTLQLDAETTFATAAQREWFGRQLPQPERWAETLAKLEALLGSGRVGIPVPAESFAPDAFTLHPAAGTAVTGKSFLPDCPVPLHRFRPAREISVAYETRGRQPWPLALLNGPHPGEIIARRGPFPASGSWWEPVDAWQRLEWDLQLATGHLIRLVFQTPDRWQVEGVYR